MFLLADSDVEDVSVYTEYWKGKVPIEGKHTVSVSASQHSNKWEKKYTLTTYDRNVSAGVLSEGSIGIMIRSEEIFSVCPKLKMSKRMYYYWM